MLKKSRKDASSSYWKGVVVGVAGTAVIGCFFLLLAQWSQLDEKADSRISTVQGLTLSANTRPPVLSEEEHSGRRESQSWEKEIEVDRKSDISQQQESHSNDNYAEGDRVNDKEKEKDWTRALEEEKRKYEDELRSEQSHDDNNLVTRRDEGDLVNQAGVMRKKKSNIPRVKGTKDSTIFIAIAAYRDSECGLSLIDMFDKAEYPERIHVGIVQHISSGHSTEESCRRYLDLANCGSKFAEEERICQYTNNIIIKTYPRTQGKGPVDARHKVQVIYAILNTDTHPHPRTNTHIHTYISTYTYIHTYVYIYTYMRSTCHTSTQDHCISMT